MIDVAHIEQDKERKKAVGDLHEGEEIHAIRTESTFFWMSTQPGK